MDREGVSQISINYFESVSIQAKIQMLYKCFDDLDQLIHPLNN